MKQRYTLTAERLGILKHLLIPFACNIECVGMFGSHAMRTARPNSDIDLVIYGELADTDIDRIWTLIDDSALAVTADVVAYNDRLYPPLRAHIDRTMTVLFTRDDLQDLKAA